VQLVILCGGSEKAEMALPAAAPNIPEVVAATGPPVEEMQTLEQPALVQDGEARELRFMGPAAADPSSSQTISDRAAHEADHEARTRVLKVSLFLAIYVVVGALIHYALDIAVFEEVMHSFHRKVYGETPNLALIVINGIPKLTFSIGVSLLVPLCGYLGIKQNEQGLLGCFCCCNLCSFFGGLVGLVTLVILMVGAMVAAPGLEIWMERCDPMHCAPEGLNVTQRSHVVDCLAAGYWEEYKPRFTNHGHWYPHDCPKAFLTCKSWENSKGLEVQLGQEPHRMASPMFRGGAGGWDPEAPDRRLAWRHQLRQDALARQQSLQSDLYHGRHEEPLPMPKDPTEDCRPNEGVENFHQARGLLPELLPKFVGYLFLRVVLAVPLTVLGLFGFLAGKDMWTRLGQGYSQVTVQPALGHLAAPPSNEVQLAQHLMQSTPLAPHQQQQAPQQGTSQTVVTGTPVQPAGGHDA